MANVQPRFVTFSITVSTDVAVVAAKAGKRFSGYKIYYRAKVAATVQWKSGSTSLSLITHAANDIRDSIVDPGAGNIGLLQSTNIGETLFLNGGAGHVGGTSFMGELAYVELP